MPIGMRFKTSGKVSLHPCHQSPTQDSGVLRMPQPFLAFLILRKWAGEGVCFV